MLTGELFRLGDAQVSGGLSIWASRVHLVCVRKCSGDLAKACEVATGIAKVGEEFLQHDIDECLLRRRGHNQDSRVPFWEVIYSNKSSNIHNLKQKEEGGKGRWREDGVRASVLFDRFPSEISHTLSTSI